MGEVLTWLLFFFILIALLVMIVFQLMCLADLEFDYINPYDSASRINKVVLPEFITQGVLCLLFLFTGHWFMSLLCVPYLYYNVRLVGLICIYNLSIPLQIFPERVNPKFMSLNKYSSPSSLSLCFAICNIVYLARYLQRQHLVDVTEIFNLLNWEKKQRLFKLGYIILLLFMCLFWMIYNALDEDEHSF